jgi:hypothetical protein
VSGNSPPMVRGCASRATPRGGGIGGGRDGRSDERVMSDSGMLLKARDLRKRNVET